MQTKTRDLCEGVEQVNVRGLFAPQGTGAPVITEGNALWTVSRTGVGTFNVVFAETYQGTPVVTLGLSDTTTGRNVQQTAWTQATRTLTLVVYTTSTAAAVDPAANANNQVSFVARFRTQASTVG